MEDRGERVKMRREFGERRKETGAKKESKEEWAGRKTGMCCVKIRAGETDQDSPVQAGGPLWHQEEGAGRES